MKQVKPTIQELVFKVVDQKVTNECFDPTEKRTDNSFDEIVRSEVEAITGNLVKLTTVCRYVELYKNRYKNYKKFLNK
jgi:hypothetical protein